MKRTVRISALVCMIFVFASMSLLPVRVSALVLEGECGENITWTLDVEKEILTISGSGPMYDFSERDENGEPNWSPWNDYPYRVRTVIIEDGITYIGDYTFYRCTYLTSVTIPESVTKIGSYVFRNCVTLKEIKLPDSLEAMGEYVFMGCKQLERIDYPEGASIPENAFEGIGERIHGCSSSIGGASVIAVLIGCAYIMKKHGD